MESPNTTANSARRKVITSNNNNTFKATPGSPASSITARIALGLNFSPTIGKASTSAPTLGTGRALTSINNNAEARPGFARVIDYETSKSPLTSPLRSKTPTLASRPPLSTSARYATSPNRQPPSLHARVRTTTPTAAHLTPSTINSPSTLSPTKFQLASPITAKASPGTPLLRSRAIPLSNPTGSISAATLGRPLSRRANDPPRSSSPFSSSSNSDSSSSTATKIQEGEEEALEREIKERKLKGESDEKDRIRRKVLDLEITNTSLLAINGSLELLKVRNRSEIKDLRRRLRESTTGLLPSYNTLGTIPDERSSCCSTYSGEGNDDGAGETDEEIVEEGVDEEEMTWEEILREDGQFAQIATHLHSLITKGSAAVQHIELGASLKELGRVLHSSEVYGIESEGGEQSCDVSVSQIWSREGSGLIEPVEDRFDEKWESPDPVALDDLGLGFVEALNTTQVKFTATELLRAHHSSPIESGSFSQRR